MAGSATPGLALPATRYCEGCEVDEYFVVLDGVEHRVLLDPAEAARVGAVPVKSRTPRDKSRTPADKSPKAGEMRG